ncbi:type III-A CRISPR-associated protein Cas10/Csm1 [Thermoproteus tenax]|uniref:CRISPR system associated protein, predicted polymearase fused to HD hydrolase domain n=1 Tax=Thermoproteus tenax (strain ATCC 35583 / DSM 2078 / JCM 9277 / NBRC 100435 / Kra 1) TaxID=768679 RepID=G4RJX3_THETK|nr:type III-A CRISPR-associated protein Cas10/Csm1 [Thermoproteus tenax]CCC81868.1 CRISPR system associated protein, predicted polymearase fused to HD hydrolase domain [Thermoproteus tenax Kra 1]
MSGSREYVVAALLHDVGKLIRRAKLCSGEPARRHVEESADFVDSLAPALKAAGVDPEAVRELVLRHHEGDWGVGPYDRAAARERTPGDEESGQGLAMPDRREHEIPLRLPTGVYVPPCPTPQRVRESPSPSPQPPSPEEVCRCYKSAYEELRRLAAKVAQRRMGFKELVETLVNILKATTAFVPAAVYGVKEPDTSLYAHSLLAAALASTGGEFYLVSIDVGRIQEYISRAGSTKAAMAILRGRSLRINALQRAAVRWLIDRVETATYANVLLDTGGEALLLLPKFDLALLDQLESRVLQETEGALALYAAAAGPYRLEDVARFKDLMRELSQRVTERKFIYRDYKAPSGPAAKCQFCGQLSTKVAPETLEDGEVINLCHLCRDELHIGRAARNLGYIVFTSRSALPPGQAKIEQKGTAIVHMLDYAVVFGNQALLKPTPSAVYATNRRDFILDADGPAYGMWFTNTHIYYREGEDSSLDAAGRYAAFVKMDANSMGKLKEAASRTPSALVTFSLAVSTAYELYPALLADESYREEPIFVIYAGGDDAVLAGNIEALRYAASVATYAEKWGFKTAIGAKIDKPQYPIYFAFADTEERLERAKRIDRGRSIVVLIAEPVTIYEEAAELEEDLKYIPRYREDEEARRMGAFERKVYERLFAAYAAAAVDDKVDKRALAKIAVELVYMLKRREGDEDTVKVLREVAGPLFANAKEVGSFFADLMAGKRRLDELRRAVLRLYLHHIALAWAPE